MFNNISVVVFIVTFAVVGISTALASYFYSSMSTGLLAKAQTASNFFKNIQTSAAYIQYAENLTETFTDKDKLELQFINANGLIQLSSYGLTAGTSPGTGDISNAISAGTISLWRGTDPSTGERIMAVSSPIVVGDQVVGLLRYVTSLKVVDQQIFIIIGISILIGIGIIAIVYSSNLYFIRSIVEPVAEMTQIAKRIAAGGYGVQIEKKFNDEIGELSDTINDMSMKISQSEKMKSEFISSVSHELRTPLTAISGWAETLAAGEVQEQEDMQKGLNIIVSESRRLTKLVEELLEFSRIEDGRFFLNIEPVDIKAALEDAVFTYREFFRKEGILLEYRECEEDIPELSADPSRLHQVFSNLLDNAAKHGGSGKKIIVSIEKLEHEVRITVRDFGPGIPPEELPHVKYMFYKGSSKARGNGIGLSVCEEIVGLHNGRLEISNAEGGGVEAAIYLPFN
ncbi:MAG: HAMP domain-containing sensor histidine kinase [Oscillospiraceae bacterium]|nr:HAMP domain-containing sensor histidine kinase [Oscillospiraceae bacterium]